MSADPPRRRPRRALVVTHYWAPHVGGIERVAAEQAARLAERGWEIRVATSRQRGDPREARMGPVHLHRYRCLNVLERRLDVPVPLMSPSMLRDLFRHTAWADVVLIHGHTYVGSVYAAVAARRSSTPFVLVQHSPFVSYGTVLDHVERQVDRQIGVRVLRAASSVFAVSSFTQAFVRSLAADLDPHLLHAGVDGERFAPRPVPRQQPLVFLTVRRLVPRTGVDVLIDAWRRADLGAGALLVIVGDGAERARLRSMSRHDPSIELRGHVDDDALPDVYRAADVFVLPSRTGEGFGLAAAEALASGLPVIATESGGVTDLVHDGVNGMVVPPGDPDALARALMLVASDSHLRSRLQAGARDSVEGASWSRSIDRLEAALTGGIRP